MIDPHKIDHVVNVREQQIGGYDVGIRGVQKGTDGVNRANAEVPTMPLTLVPVVSQVLRHKRPLRHHHSANNPSENTGTQ